MSKWPTGENDPRYHQRFKYPKWNRLITPLDEPKLLRYTFPELTKADHERLAREWIKSANMLHEEWVRGGENLLAQYGSQGPLISGIVRSHFPEWAKTSMRTMAHRASLASSIAWAHWKAAGKRMRLPGAGSRYGA